MAENQKRMSRDAFLLEIDEILGLRPGTLQGDEKLEELQNWDSTALIGVIVLAESASDRHISPDQVVSCSTVADLLRLAGVDGRSVLPVRSPRNIVRVRATERPNGTRHPARAAMAGVNRRRQLELNICNGIGDESDAIRNFEGLAVPDHRRRIILRKRHALRRELSGTAESDSDAHCNFRRLDDNRSQEHAGVVSPGPGNSARVLRIRLQPLLRGHPVRESGSCGSSSPMWSLFTQRGAMFRNSRS